MSTRKKVEIPDEAWLDTLKFLVCPQWQKMRFVSRQLAEVIRGNVSELPRIIIHNVKFWETFMPLKPAEIVACNVTIPLNEKKEWFMKRGINLDAPAGLQHQDAVIGKPSIYYYADVNGLDGALKTTRAKQKTVWQKLSGQGYDTQNSVTFSSEFNPIINEYFWASIEYFFNLLYNPRTYIKNIKMYALNENLTDSFFLGEDYASYIHCGKFTLMGDLCKSLQWIQRNVRADTIFMPGEFTDIENSYKETSNFLLGKPWKCAKQTPNVTPVQIKLEWVRRWKWFLKSLIKKFCALTTIDCASPSIEFSFRKAEDEILNLNYLVWDPQVVKLNSQGVYVVSNGQNRMEIKIFPQMWQNPTNRTTDIYDVSVKSYTIESAMPSREKVHILNDTWLETLKFLKFPQWSKACFVSRQLVGVVQRNISRLPCIVIDSATMSEKAAIYDSRIHKGIAQRSLNSAIVAFGDKLEQNEANQFFTELGISLDALTNIQLENTVIGISSKSWNSYDHYVEMCLCGTADDLQTSQKSVIFSEHFNKRNVYFWAGLKYLLKFLYYPALHIKEVEMFALNQKMVDTVFDYEERVICCGSFTWKRETFHINHKNEHIYDYIVNFLLDASWKCACQEVNLKCLCNLGSFVQALVKKFQTVPFVQKDSPMFTAFGCGKDETMSFLLLDPNVLKLESQDSGDADVFVISNGDNRMHIKIFKQNIRVYENCHMLDHLNWQSQDKLKVSIKITAV